MRARTPRLRRNNGPQPHRPKLGQHFLADDNYRRRIADSLGLRPNELVIEIGPGRGAMTQLLAERARRVVAIELDRALAERLTEKYDPESRIEILQQDILSTDIGEICRRHQAGQVFVFGNIPYYITSPILERLRIFRDSIRAMALLMQKEVADRIVASPGSRDYGYLSVFVQLFSHPRILFGVPSGAFAPPPKVHSALVEFQMVRGLPHLSEEDLDGLLTFVTRCFTQKRKNLINNLSSMASRKRLEQELDRLQLPPTIRAEEISIEQFADLFKRFR